MSNEPVKNHRQSIRLKGYDYSIAGLYFITICTHNRAHLFGKIVDRYDNGDIGTMVLNDAGKMARQCWSEIPIHFPNVILHQYIIMPNHIHGILEIVGANKYSPNVGAKYISPNDGTVQYSPNNNHSNGMGNISPINIDISDRAKNVSMDHIDISNRAKSVSPLRSHRKRLVRWFGVLKLGLPNGCVKTPMSSMFGNAIITNTLFAIKNRIPTFRNIS